MTDLDTIPAELAGRFRSRLVLKQDVFSTVERGSFLTPNGEVEAVHAPDRSRALVELRALRSTSSSARRAVLRSLAAIGVAPPLLYLGERGAGARLDRRSAAAYRKARRRRSIYFRSARRALRAIHRECLTHNDLAKEQNWLRTPTGYASLTDFQLATRFCAARRHVPHGSL